MKPLDISGQRFGRLTAIERRGTAWLCRCDCGTEKVIYLGNLKQRNTTSCGCYRREACVKREAQKAEKRGCNPALNTKFSYYQRNAKLRGVPWKLTRGDFEQILSVPCHYCGADEQIGIDRIDSALGYDYTNVLACCKECNQAKNDRSIEQFAAWIYRTYQHFKATDWSLG